MIAMSTVATTRPIDPGRTAVGLGVAFAVEIAVGLVGLGLCARLRRPSPAHVAPNASEVVP
jgi:hypothetical protein